MDTTKQYEIGTSGNGGSNIGASRTGLFRTPISGGVHSATAVHDLPPPALAVRNLMEQVCLLHSFLQKEAIYQ
jgi:Fic family protein